jgi:hypothetical protein
MTNYSDFWENAFWQSWQDVKAKRVHATAPTIRQDLNSNKHPDSLRMETWSTEGKAASGQGRNAAMKGLTTMTIVWRNPASPPVSEHRLEQVVANDHGVVYAVCGTDRITVFELIRHCDA